MVTAPPGEQLRLITLQAYDSALVLSDHQRRALPEHAEIARTEAEVAALSDEVVGYETTISDLRRAEAKLEAEIDVVRARAARDQQRMTSGSITTSKELENLQSEIASLARRQAVLEDEQFALMEQRDAAETSMAEVVARRSEVLAARDSAVARRDASLAELDRQAALARSSRDLLAPQLPADLLALYEKLRAGRGGVGAARLTRRSCEGCHIELFGTELTAARNAAPDAVLRCEECGRILVRTEESGL